MQRMLVGLVLFLTLVVSALGIMVFDLRSELTDLGKARAPEGVGREPVAESPHAGRIDSLDQRFSQLLNEMKVLRRRSAAAPPRVAAPSNVDRPAAPPALAAGGGFLNATDRVRDGNGEFMLTEADEELFLALQQRAQRRQRIESTTKGVMRRIDRMADKGEMAAIPEADRANVRAVIKRYVASGEDMMRHYVRQPSEATRLLTFEERRTQYGAERDELVAQATLELAPLLGEADAAKAAEAGLQSPWGRRLGAGRRNSARKRRN